MRGHSSGAKSRAVQVGCAHRRCGNGLWMLILAWPLPLQGSLSCFTLLQDFQLENRAGHSPARVRCWSSQWSVAASMCGRAWSSISSVSYVSSSQSRRDLLSSHENARLVAEQENYEKVPTMQVHCNETWANREGFISILMALFISLHEAENTQDTSVKYLTDF